jgi:uncharacterized protein YbaP (TraB family)
LYGRYRAEASGYGPIFSNFLNMNILSKLSLSLLALLTVSGLWSQDSLAPTTEDKALLWQITHSEGTDTSYLFGTIHIIPEEHYIFNEATRLAFERSATVAFEIDTESMMNPMALMGLMSQMNMKDGVTLKDLLSEEEYAMVAKHFEDKGLPMMFMGRIKPMFLSMLAGQDAPTAEGGMDPGQGFNMMGEGMKSYELELTELAKTTDKPITGLETAEFQMSLFDEIPYEEQAQMLVKAIESGSEGEDDMMQRMVDLYLDQDIVGMQDMMAEADSGVMGYEEILLLQRNRNWIPVMAELMAKGSVFFAVGAGHLAGDEGVITLLRKEGYAVEPIK